MQPASLPAPLPVRPTPHARRLPTTWRVCLGAGLLSLAACGGDHRPPPPVARPTPAAPSPRSGPGTSLPIIGLYGDSLLAGTATGQPNNLIAVPPVRRLRELSHDRMVTIDYSRPGATTVDALRGGYAMPFEAWDTHMKTAPEQLVVLRYGGADFILGVQEKEFRRSLTQLVRVAQSHGKTVVLVGLIPVFKGVMKFDKVLRSVAWETRVRYIELSRVPFQKSELIDGIHPGQAYSDRLVQKLTPQLIQAL